MSDNKLNLVVQFSALDKLSGALKNIVGLGRTGTQALTALRRQSRDLNGELAKVRSELAGASGNVTELTHRERQLEAAIAGTAHQLERQKKLLTINSTVGKVHAQGERLMGAGQNNVIMGATMLTPFIIAGKAAMDFSSGMVDIQQKAQLTNRETAQMARNIIKAADAAHQLPEAMRGGVDVLAGFGLDPRVAEKMIGPIGRLGTAFKVEIADGAAAAFANLNNLKIASADTARALDIMAAGGNYGAFEVKDMARYFPALTAQMQALGQKGLGAAADMTAALEIARRGTGDAESAATNVQDLLAKINAPVTINAFKQHFGIDLPAAMKLAYAQGKTPLEAIAELTKKATGGDLSKIGFVFRNQEAAGAVRSLIQNMEDYRRIRSDLGQSGGTVDRAFSQREMQDASVAWNSFKGSASALAITLGTTVLPVATQFFRQINSVMGAVSRWAQANPAAARSLMTLVAGFAAAKVGLGVLQYAFGSIIGPMATLWGWYQKFKLFGGLVGVFSRVAGAFGMLRTAALFLGQGMMRAGLMMLANPMVLLIMAIGIAIGVVAYLVYRNWAKISGAFNAGVAWVKSTLSALPAWMKSIGSMMMSGLLMALNPALLVSKLLSVAKSGITAFKNYFGIKSPSRLFMEMGGHMTQGLAMGVENGGKRPLGSMARLATGMAGAGALALSGPALAGHGQGSLRNPQGSHRGAVKIEIHIHQQPGEDAHALAERVSQVLERKQRQARTSTFGDDF